MAPGSIFFGSLLSDLVTMVLLPIPVLGAVLLYFDIRSKLEDFTPDNLRTDLEALKNSCSALSVQANSELESQRRSPGAVRT